MSPQRVSGASEIFTPGCHAQSNRLGWRIFPKSELQQRADDDDTSVSGSFVSNDSDTDVATSDSGSSYRKPKSLSSMFPGGRTLGQKTGKHSAWAAARGALKAEGNDSMSELPENWEPNNGGDGDAENIGSPTNNQKQQHDTSDNFDEAAAFKIASASSAMMRRNRALGSMYGAGRTVRQDMVIQRARSTGQLWSGDSAKGSGAGRAYLNSAMKLFRKGKRVRFAADDPEICEFEPFSDFEKCGDHTVGGSSLGNETLHLNPAYDVEL